MKVADFGAGSGAYTLAIAGALEGYGRIYAIDVQRDLLRRIANEAARKELNNVEVVWADLEKRGATKLADDALDLVLISNLLFQVENKKNVLSESFRVLHPGGRLTIIDWQESFGGMGPQKGDVVTKERALTLAKEVGYELQREFLAGAHHYGLIFRRPLAVTKV